MKDFQEVEKFIVAKLQHGLAKDLFYHGLHHTLYVMDHARMIGEKERISGHDMLLLKVAALYHDSGFIKVYKGHEEAGCELAKQDLPPFGFSGEEIDTICGMIRATKIPQAPHTQLERIIADADLEYMGTDSFEATSKTLFAEIKIYLGVESEKQWNVLQMNFLKNHHYFTDFCQKEREPVKQKHLAQLVSLVADQG